MKKGLPNCCVYCGTGCRGLACLAHADLPNVDPKYMAVVSRRTAA